MRTLAAQPLCIALLLAVASAAFAEETKPPTLVVTGRGQVTSTPDRAIVSFGAIAESKEAAAAQAQVNEIMQAAIEAVKDQDVEDKKLSTSNLVLMPNYDYSNNRQKIVGYRASYVLTVIVDDLTKVGDVIDAALASGINQFQGVQFTLKDDTASRLAALKQAAGDAQSKAKAIADAMGVKLTGIRQITESGDGFQPPQPVYAARGAAMMKAEMDTPIQAGELNTDATVTVEYLIAPAE